MVFRMFRQWRWSASLPQTISMFEIFNNFDVCVMVIFFKKIFNKCHICLVLTLIFFHVFDSFHHIFTYTNNFNIFFNISWFMQLATF